MANELLYSGAGDMVLTETLGKMFLLLLADRAYIGNHPALYYAGDLQGSGSATIQLAEIGWDGYDILQDTNENTAATETAVNDDSVTVTVARKSMARNISDLLSIVDSIGLITNPEAFARDAVGAKAGKLMDMICQITDGFAATSGPGTGVDADLDSFLVGNIQLDVANVPGDDRLALLHPQQVGDIQRDLATAASGAYAFDRSTKDFIDMRGTGWKGELAGVDVFSSGRVPTVNAGADRGGAIFGRGAVVWADATIPPNPMNSNYAFYVGKMLIEFARGASGASTAIQKIVYNAYLGASMGIDAAGTTFISDA